MDDLVGERRVTDEELVTLLVVESGAPWPDWAGRLAAGATTNLVETEVLGETEAEFESRVMVRLTRLRERQRPLARAGYVPAPNSPRGGSRERMCAALLEQMDPEGELILAGGNWPQGATSEPDSAEMFDLWQRLSERGSTQLVSLRFNDVPSTPLNDSILEDRVTPLTGSWQ